MNNRWFKFQVSALDHPLLSDPWELGAWVWLIGSAAPESCRVRVGRTPVSLERGQLCFSLRFLANKWNCSTKKVTAFLDRLQQDGMIGNDKETGQTRITICNYNEYQDVETARKRKRNTEETQTETGRKQVGNEELDIPPFGDPPKGGSPLSPHGEDQPKKHQKSKKGTRLPENWRPNEAGIALAVERGFSTQDISDETASFRDYWLSLSGAKATKLDWDRTWNNWVRNSRRRPGGGNRSYDGRSEMARALDELEASVATRSDPAEGLGEGTGSDPDRVIDLDESCYSREPQGQHADTGRLREVGEALARSVPGQGVHRCEDLRSGFGEPFRAVSSGGLFDRD